MAACAIAGAAAAWIWRGWRHAAGFALGAAFSALMFHWFHRVAEALGPDTEMPSRPRLAWLGALRYGLIAGGAYVMMEILGIDPLSIVIGLLVMVAAVLLELLFQLVYART